MSAGASQPVTSAIVGNSRGNSPDSRSYARARFCRASGDERNAHTALVERALWCRDTRRRYCGFLLARWTPRGYSAGLEVVVAAIVAAEKDQRVLVDAEFFQQAEGLRRSARSTIVTIAA